MKNKYRIFIIALIVVAASAALIYWQSNKNTIIENRIDKVVTKKSGSLFSITYDSSFIDELNGNAFFYNVSLSPDTMLAKSQDVKNVFKVSIAEVAIKGANIIGLLTGTTLQAHSLQFINPIFEIENRNQQAQPYSKDDTLALYEKLLGKYNSIKADEIIVNNGSVKILNSYNNTLTTLKQIDINLANFKIDSTKDYENLVSYFVKGLEARVGSITGGPRLSPGYLLDQINYSATNRKMTVQNFRVFKNKEVVTNLKNLSIDGLETGIFLREQRIVANELKTAGGQVTIYRKKGNKLNALETDSTVFDKAKIRKVEIGKSRVVIINKDKPGDAPFVLNDVEFTATDIPEVDGTFTKSIAASNWLIRGSGIKSLTENKGYNINIGPYVLDKGRMFATVENFSIKPKLTEAAFVKSLKVQADYFQVEGHSLAIKNINFEEAFSKQSLLASEVSFRPSIKIYNDRTLPRNPKSKIPTDPAELVKNLNFPIAIEKLVINNGYFSYRERGMISGKIGMLFFDKLNATISNITNIPSIFNKTPDMVLRASTSFIGKTSFNTIWRFPLNKNNGPYTLSGTLGPVDGKLLNVALEPQAMISVRQGQINSFVFETTGDFSKAHTKGTLLYNGLKLNVLKKVEGETELQKKTALSFLANIFIDDRNPDHGKVRQNEIDFSRDSSRSFFYLVSQSFFLAIRKTITGKNNVK